MNWIKFEDQLPTEEPYGQVDILFAHPTWATFFRGLYTHVPGWSLRERLSQYDPFKDRFYDWEAGGINGMPIYWMRCPEMPAK